MKKNLAKVIGYGMSALVLILIFGLVGCGGSNQAISAEPTEEVIPTEAPTKEVSPTEAPTEEVIPTEEPTKAVIPTEEPTEEVLPTEEVFDLPPILGIYSVTGLDPDYNNYEGSLEISASDGVFQWDWIGRDRSGIGIFQEDVVSVIWGAGSKDCKGVWSYIVQEDGVLEADFIEKGIPGFGDEKSTPTGEMGEGIEGTYMAIGITGNGFSYVADLDIARNGDVYDFHWDLSKIGGEQYYGVGIQRGNIVSVAGTSHEDSHCMIVSYLIEEDGALDGIWTYLGSSELGTDVATPETSN